MKDESFKDFVVDQLSALGAVAGRAMFGGHGLYLGERCFGIAFQGRLYFKVSDATRPAYLERGMKPFRPGARQTLRSFFVVPAEVLESPENLCAWARSAAAAAGEPGFDNE